MRVSMENIVEKLKPVVAIIGIGLLIDPFVQGVALNSLRALAMSLSVGLSACSSQFSAAVIMMPNLVTPVVVEGALITAAVILAVIAVRYVCRFLSGILKPARKVPQTLMPGFSTSCTCSNNHITINIASVDMQNDPARCLNVIAGGLSQVTDFNDSNLTCNYSHGTDCGGLSRECFNDIMRLLFTKRSELTAAALQFQQNDKGFCNLTDSGRPLEEADRQLCQDMGILIGALCAGFGSQRECKLANILSPQFYAGLICLSEQRAVNSFAISPEARKNTVCRALAETNPDDPLFDLPLEDLCYCYRWDDRKLNKLFNYLLVLDWNAEITSLNAFKAALQDENIGGVTLVQIHQFVTENCVESYENFCAPLFAVEERFSQVNGASRKMRVRVGNSGNLLSKAQRLTQFIQGEPFTREGLFSRLEVGRGERAKELKWVLEWLGKTDQEPLWKKPHKWIWKKYYRATDAECRQFLKFGTGSDSLTPKRLTLSVSTDVLSFYARTCTPKIDIPSRDSETAFIRELRQAIQPDLQQFTAS